LCSQKSKRQIKTDREREASKKYNDKKKERRKEKYRRF